MYTKSIPAQAWSEADDAVILARINEHPFPAYAVSKALGRTLHSVKARAYRKKAELRAGGEVIKASSQLGQKRSPLGTGHRITKKTELVVLSCLGCQKLFKSWDKVKNRLCPNCGSQREDVTHVRHSFNKGA